MDGSRKCAWGIPELVERTGDSAMRNTTLLILAVLVLIGSGAPAGAIVIDSTVRTTIIDSYPADGFPNSWITPGTRIYKWALSGGTTEGRAVIEFPISSLTSPVASATLDLTKSDSSDFLPTPLTIDVYGYPGNNIGAPDSSDWFRAIPENKIGSISYENEATVNFDVTTFLNAQIAANTNYAGFLLVWASAPDSFGRREKRFGFLTTDTFPTLTISDVGGNIPPVATDDLAGGAAIASTQVNTSVNVDVLANDTDLDVGSILTVNSYDSSSSNGGSVSCSLSATTPTAQCTFNPAIDACGTDTFTYDATDGTDSSNRATVTIQVGDANPPIVTAPANLGITLLAGDLGPLPATDSRVIAWLASATANDSEDGGVAVSDDAPANFPVGTTLVTFTAIDSCGTPGTAMANVAVQLAPPDADGDGVPDTSDSCPATITGPVDAVGCSDIQVDGDSDGYCDIGALSTGPLGCIGTDNCPTVFNPGQAQTGNNEGGPHGDACVPPDLDTGKATVEPGAVIEPGAVVNQGVTVKAGAYVGANAILGKNSTINQNAVVGANSKVKQGSTVGTGAIVGTNVLLNRLVELHAGAKVGDNSVVGQKSDIFENAVVGCFAAPTFFTPICPSAAIGAQLGQNVQLSAGAVVVDGAVIPKNMTVP
jgi:acetyltransferase-like isoleucine patch superfamily enzyme